MGDFNFGSGTSEFHRGKEVTTLWQIANWNPGDNDDLNLTCPQGNFGCLLDVGSSSSSPHSSAGGLEEGNHNHNARLRFYFGKSSASSNTSLFDEEGRLTNSDEGSWLGLFVEQRSNLENRIVQYEFKVELLVDNLEVIHPEKTINTRKAFEVVEDEDGDGPQYLVLHSQFVRIQRGSSPGSSASTNLRLKISVTPIYICKYSQQEGKSDVDVSREANLCEALKEMYTSGEIYPDILVETKNGKRLKAHKFMLAARSPVLRQIIGTKEADEEEDDYDEDSFTGTDILKLDDVKYIVMKSILHWMYTGELLESVVSGVGMDEVVDVAIQLELTGFLGTVDTHIIRVCRPENMFQLYRLALRYGLGAAATDISNFIENAMSFIRFPLEVCEVILGKLETFQDIRNTFQAFPQLESGGVLKKERKLYLFEQVIPLIFPYLNKKDFLSYRKVCKWWRRGVDNSLENSRGRRAYNPVPSFANCARLPDISRPFSFQSKQPYFCNIYSLERLRQFQRTLMLESSVPVTNPFPGRGLQMSPVVFKDDTQAYFNEARQLLHGFGDQVWFLTLEFRWWMSPPSTLDFGESALRCSQFFLDCLTRAPNLKRLVIDIESWSKSSSDGEPADDWEEAENFFETEQGRFPPLPQLESLIIGNPKPVSMTRTLVSLYSKQLRKVELHLENWRREYSTQFPELTELSLDSNSKQDVVRLVDLLRLLDAPKLHKLVIGFQFGYLNTANLIELLIRPLLGRFPLLHSLVIHPTVTNWRDSELKVDVESFSLPQLPENKVKSFTCRIGHVFLDVDLLKCFPSLETFKLYFDNYKGWGVFPPCEVVIGSHVWNVLPSLRVITLEISDGLGSKVIYRKQAKAKNV